MKLPNSTAEGVCPICGGSARPLLALQAQPIYQHPVAPEAQVPLPHYVDLSWVACGDCAHAWQPAFDSDLLEGIYRSYYYTPAPAGIGRQFHDDFLATLQEFRVSGPRRVLIEIGASAGEVLADLKALTGASRAYAFEPNHENAALASARGLDVRMRFFAGDVGRENLEKAELIYARHVIEHVFDFGDFFTGLDIVAAPGAHLVLETPSLDFHAGRGSLDPFHIEHIHVFSLRSLARLAGLRGWGLQRSTVTAHGNLIALFGRSDSLVEAPAPYLDGMQAAVTARALSLQELFANRELVFWGAGSAGVALARVIDREPDIWTDGNPNKVGKKFVGLGRHIVSPEEAMAEARALHAPILVITSSFQQEILPRVRQLGWAAPIFDAHGNSL
jgi:hypothetical protein